MGADTSQLKGSPDAFKIKDLQSLSNLTPGYILKLKERFESSSDDYNLTRQGLKDYFKCRDNEIETIFKLFDVDGNGSIDSYEFVCGLSLMAHATLDEKADLIFNLYDFDRSQSISKDELTVLMTNALTALKNMEGKPAPTISEIELKTNEFFQQADEDQNNQISLKEFKSFIKQDKQCLQVLMSYGVALRSDLGTDFGTGEGLTPHIDQDLDIEIKPSALKRNEKQINARTGITNEFEEQDLGAGDQCMNGDIKASVPSWYRPSKRDSEAPTASLELDYIYGIRCHDVRNNLHYNDEGKLTYNCAGVGVVLDQKTNVQKHFMSHGDDIHCCAVDPSGLLCATGEIGPKPRFCVWNTKTMAEEYTASGPMTKGIKHAAFSPNGQYVACTDMDEHHNLYIFDVKKKLKPGQPWTPIAYGIGIRSEIMSLGWNATSDEVIATAVRQVAFFKFENGKVLGVKNGSGFGKQPADTILSQAQCGNNLFTGHLSGEIIAWTGHTVSQRYKGHASKVNSLRANQAGTVLISGGADGVVTTWKVEGTTITRIKDYNLKSPELKSMRSEVTAVCESTKGDTLAVATRGGEIFEFNQSTGKASVLLRGHFDDELWGLATHPTQPEIYTWGRDAMLAVWDLKTHRQKKHCKLEAGGDAIAFSNNAKYLVLGFLNGTMLVLDENFTAVKKRRDRAGKAIQVIKFTPDDRILAAGGHDQMVMTYDVVDGFKPMKKLKAHPTTIWQMDFSLDSQTLIHDGGVYYDLMTGKHNPKGPSTFKDETWHTWSLRTGWPVQGIWPQGNDCNTVARSPDGTTLAAGDDFGFVKLYKYPCPVPKSSHHKYTGHSSHVTNMMFTKNMQGQQYLISTGGMDKCIFQWKYHRDAEAVEGNQFDDEQEDVKALDDGYAKEDEETQASNEFGGDEFAEEDIGEGDQALAVKPFLGQVKAMTPSDFKVAKNAGQAPNTNLKLKWAHGFRSFDTRNNLKYAADGSVVFTTAGVGVVQNLAKNTQEFFNLHKEDIVAMAIHPDKDIIATGQMAGKELNEASAGRRAVGDKLEKQESKQGKLVQIYIWRASTREVIAKIIGFHRRAVRQLAFSPSGKKLLSIGEDDKHSVAIYDWASQNKLCDASVDLAQVYDAKWSTDENTFATCGTKHLKVFKQNGQTLQGAQCNFRALGQGVQLCSVNYVLNNQLVSGSSKGELVPWNGTSMGKPIKAHSAPIWCIEKGANNTFYSGSNDGKVIIWNAQMQASKTIDIKSLVNWQPESGIRSLDIKSDGTLLVGTRGSDVLQVSAQGTLIKKVVQGHFKGVADKPEVWGCATHPSEQIFATTGADLCVRTWHENKMVAVSQQLPSDPTAVDWSGCGKFLAIGDRNGDCTIMDAKTLQVLGSIKSSLSGKKDAWVEDIKFSPDSMKVAFGTHGGTSKLEVVTVNSQGKPTSIAHGKLGLSSALICVDWSQDGHIIVVNSQSYELLFADANSLKQVSASAVKEVQWKTWTCRFGFASQGIWPGVDYTDVNSVDRSRNGQLLATGDDFGLVKLFKYPCVVEKAESHEYAGHSSHVTKVKFSANDRYVVSTGGNDMTVMVWETDVNGGQAAQEHQCEEVADYDENPDDPCNEVKVDRARLEREKAKARKHQQEQDRLVEQNGDGNEFAEADLGEGDQFLAVKPWMGQMKPPSSFKRAAKGANLAPSVELHLEWVHGYKGDSTKNNLRYLDDGSLAYYIAAVGVVYNPEMHTQKFFQMHTDDITCMDFHPDGVKCATGENGKKPKAFLWDTQTMKMVHQFVGHGIVETIIAIAFSPSGKHLALVAGNQDHNVAVYDTVSGACVAESKGPKEIVTQVAWANDQTFVLIGSKLFQQFTINAKSFTKERGNFGGKDQRIGSCVYNGNQLLTGAITGELYTWQGTAIQGVPKKLHERLIDAITVTETHVFTGARDSKITVMNKQLQVKFTIDLSTIQDSNSTQVRAITLNKAGDKMMVGTFGHEIIELPINLQANTCDVSKAKIIIHGHFAPLTTYTNEVWGLSIFPNQEKYVTCSDDGKLKVWDTASHKQIKSISLNIDKTGKTLPHDPAWKDLLPPVQGRAIDVSPKGDLIAVGMRDGTLRVFQTTTMKMLHMQKCGVEWIEDLKFSPDGKHLAVGAHDNKLYVFQMPDCKLVGKKFGASTSFITHLDWSLDSQHLRTNDGSYEILYYSVADGKQLTSGATQFRDEPWATNSCVLGWAVQGIWQTGQDGSDINHCDRSHAPIVDSQQLIATADDSGMVNLYKYPSPLEKSSSVKGAGHSSHVTKVRFSPKDNYLFSTGGNDTAVMQWRIVVPK